MNLRDLRYLVAAAETEHFGRAAERCHVSQPTLSGQIRKLEETLGIALFERGHRAVMLTEAGREMAAHAREILERARYMEESARSRRDALGGPLRIGVIPTLCPYLLPYLLPALRARSPALRPVLCEEMTATLLARLRGHEIDVALLATREEDEDLVGETLFEEPLWLALPAGHALARRRSIDAVTLGALPLLTLAEGHCLADRVRELCGSAGAETIDADLRATSLETLLQLVAADRGATLVPALAVRRARAAEAGVIYRPLALADGKRRIGLIRRRSSTRTAAIAVLTEAVRECLPPLDGTDAARPVAEKGARARRSRVRGTPCRPGREEEEA